LLNDDSALSLVCLTHGTRKVVIVSHELVHFAFLFNLLFLLDIRLFQSLLRHDLVQVKVNWLLLYSLRLITHNEIISNYRFFNLLFTLTIRFVLFTLDVFLPLLLLLLIICLCFVFWNLFVSVLWIIDLYIFGVLDWLIIVGIIGLFLSLGLLFNLVIRLFLVCLLLLLTR